MFFPGFIFFLLVVQGVGGQTVMDADVPDYMCTYPVSHDREAPQWQFYRIDNDFRRDDHATKETCWDYCNKAENCRSAQLIIHGDGRHYCYRYNIAVQELKDTGRYLHIFTQTNRDEYPTYITYDRDCAECTYPVSHAWEEPDGNIYGIDIKDDIPTFKTCQAWCNEDVRCRSVEYKIRGDRKRCDKYSISLQELKDSGRYNEIYKIRIYSIITYDKQCADPPSTACSNTYPVSHAWEHPDRKIYLIDRKEDNTLTLKTCQAWCNKDVNCRSVEYRIWGDWRWCYKYSISLQELKDSGRYNEIFNYGIRSSITYDKKCVVNYTRMCSNTYPVSHDREEPDWDRYGIDFGDDHYYYNDYNPTFKTCQDYCNMDVKCRSVRYVIDGEGWRWCAKFSIRVQDLKDMGNYSLIYTETDTDSWPTSITYDRDCECPPGLEPSSLLVDFCKTCLSGFFKPSRGSEKCTKCVDGAVSKDKTSCVEVSPTTEGPGTDVDEVSPGTKGPDTNAAAIGEPMIVLIVMIGAGAVFLAPMLPGAEVAF